MTSPKTADVSAAPLVFAIFAGAATTGLSDIALILIQSCGIGDNTGLFAGAISGGMLTFAMLFALGAGLIAVGASVFSHAVVAAILHAPMRFMASIARGEPQALTASGTLIQRSVPPIIAGVVISPIAYWAVTEFNEPFRISVLIGTAVVVTRLPAQYLANAMLRWGQSRWHLAPPKTTRTLGQITVYGAVFAVFALLIAAIVFRHEWFGAYDPFGWLQLFLFIVSVFFFVPAGARLTAARSPLRFRMSLPIVALLAAVLIMTADGARVHLYNNGGLSHWGYRGLYFSLDMDGDGSAWVIGGDCSPFDSGISPFAVEIPGNGVDEDCDGKDIPPPKIAYRDPLTLMPAFPESKRVEKGNVLLIVSDATSAKHLELYGGKRNTMPNVERFAKKSTVFEHSFALANHTSVAMPALLTGQYPSKFPNVKKLGWLSFGLPKWSNPIQLRMRREGRDAVMVAGHRLSGFVRYFDELINGKGRRVSADKLGKMAMKRLKAIGPTPPEPVFFAIHFIDPHHPYRAEKTPNKYGKSKEDRYDRELNYVDQALKPILRLMEKRTYRKRWLVIITADHGEAFFEHGHPHHGHTLYDEEIRVPLVMRIPGVKPARVSTAVSHLDIVPTLIDWCGLKKDPSLRGHSLLPAALRAVSKKTPRSRVVFSEFFRTGEVFGAYDGRFSLIFNGDQASYELYDRSNDRAQTSNIFLHRTNPTLTQLLNRHIRESKERIKEGTKSAEKK